MLIHVYQRDITNNHSHYQDFMDLIETIKTYAGEATTLCFVTALVHIELKCMEQEGTIVSATGKGSGW